MRNEVQATQLNYGLVCYPSSSFLILQVVQDNQNYNLLTLVIAINCIFVLHWNYIDQSMKEHCCDLKMHWPMVTKTIVTLKKIMVTKDYCYTLRVITKPYKPLQKMILNEILEERS